MLHVFELGGNDNAIMVAAIAWPDAHELVCPRIDEGDTAGEPLESAEDTDHIVAVICHSQSLHVRANSLDLLFYRPGLGIDTMTPLDAGAGCNTER